MHPNDPPVNARTHNDGFRGRGRPQDCFSVGRGFGRFSKQAAGRWYGNGKGFDARHAALVVAWLRAQSKAANVALRDGLHEAKSECALRLGTSAGQLVAAPRYAMVPLKPLPPSCAWTAYRKLSAELAGGPRFASEHALAQPLRRAAEHPALVPQGGRALRAVGRNSPEHARLVGERHRLPGQSGLLSCGATDLGKRGAGRADGSDTAVVSRNAITFFAETSTGHRADDVR